jgi:hypothetical protein
LPKPDFDSAAAVFDAVSFRPDANAPAPGG